MLSLARLRTPIPRAGPLRALAPRWGFLALSERLRDELGRHGAMKPAGRVRRTRRHGARN